MILINCFVNHKIQENFSSGGARSLNFPPNCAILRSQNPYPGCKIHSAHHIRRFSYKYLDRIICSSTPLRVTVLLSEVEAQNMKLIGSLIFPVIRSAEAQL